MDDDEAIDSARMDASWTEREWVRYISFRPELAEEARKLPLKPTDYQIRQFRARIQAAALKRNENTNQIPGLISRAMLRKVLSAFCTETNVIDFNSRRGPALLKSVGVKVEKIDVNSLLPPSLRDPIDDKSKR
jgi:hypothetical protein